MSDSDLDEPVCVPTSSNLASSAKEEQSTRLRTGPIKGERFTGGMSQTPYAYATGSLGPCTNVRLHIYEVPKSAQGASFYLALSAAVYKAIQHIFFFRQNFFFQGGHHNLNFQGGHHNFANTETQASDS